MRSGVALLGNLSGLPRQNFTVPIILELTSITDENILMKVSYVLPSMELNKDESALMSYYFVMCI